MNYGLYLSASGVLTNLYRQDVFANNLANVQTVGYKPDVASVRQRDAESVEDRFGPELGNELLDRLGGGVLAGPQRIDYTPGASRHTGGALDAALDQQDTFFVVSNLDPNTGQPRIHMTRDGRFTRNDEGYLVTASGGHRVLGPGDQPIQLPEGGPIRIDSAGRLMLAGEQVASVQITAVMDTDQLKKIGQNLLTFKGANDTRTPAPNATLNPGAVEASGVDPIKALMQVIEATKAVTANGNMIRYHDLVMDRAVNTLGRVA